MSNSIINAILFIIENPSSKKAYKDLETALKEEKKLREASAIGNLIEVKFNEPINRSTADEE